MTKAVLETQDLTRKYRRRVVVDHLSLTVEPGDIFGFLGRNGAGKSTTIRMALGLVRPTSGNVHLLGHDMATHSLRALRRVGAMVESPAFYENFSGRQNLRMLATLSGGADSNRIDEVLEIVGLRSRAADRVRIYSHGMRQRLGIAQALLPQPELIILDEPSDGLDPQGLSEMRELIRRLRTDLGLTIILSSHLLHEVEQLCNRVAIIDSGRLLYQGSVEDLLGTNKLIRLRVDRVAEAFELLSKDPALRLSRNPDDSLDLEVPDEQVPLINALLVQHGFLVRELSPRRESLEQVFLHLTNH